MKYLIYPIFVYLIYLYNLKSQKLIHCEINRGILSENKLRFLTYNIQRLPYFFRPKLNIINLLDKYDILCFQEDFCPDININEFKFYNIIHIGADSHLKLVDSGLTIYSRIPLQFIDFIRFNNLDSVDKLSDKGFLIVKYSDIYIINTHLQASYNLIDGGSNIAKKQFKIIIKYLRKNKISKFIIMGDFNLELDKLETKYLKLIPKKPTHYTEMSHILNKTSAFPQEGFLPLKIDGAVFNNIVIENSKTVKYDKYTDHIGVSFYLKNLKNL
jgi:exonuclease III